MVSVTVARNRSEARAPSANLAGMNKSSGITRKDEFLALGAASSPVRKALNHNPKSNPEWITKKFVGDLKDVIDELEKNVADARSAKSGLHHVCKCLRTLEHPDKVRETLLHPNGGGPSPNP